MISAIYNTVEICLTFMEPNSDKAAKGKLCLNFSAQCPFFFSSTQMSGFTDVDY